MRAKKTKQCPFCGSEELDKYHYWHWQKGKELHYMACNHGKDIEHDLERCFKSHRHNFPNYYCPLDKD
jgi:hypothetical protein